MLEADVATINIPAGTGVRERWLLFTFVSSPITSTLSLLFVNISCLVSVKYIKTARLDLNVILCLFVCT